MDEFAFIDWIAAQTKLDGEAFPVGPGDDCAVMRFGDAQLLVTTDQCADGVHFVVAECGHEAAGYKVMARNLSDIAAMGGKPLAGVATVALPRGTADADAQVIYRGLRRAGDAFGCPVIGGDITAWGNPLLLTVTMLGRPVGEAPVLRSGTRPGDRICVTGLLGGSLASGRHLNFTPRVREAQELVTRYPIHAMIDISDGLAADLRHVCRASRVGAELLAAEIPTSPTAQATRDPLRAALGDGEDYELLFCLPAGAAERLLAEQPLAELPSGVRISAIGQVVKGESIVIVNADGSARPLEELGFRHAT